MKRYFVYILKSADGTYHTDFTSNLEARLKNRQEAQLVFQAEFPLPAFAIAARRQIRRWPREKQEALIQGHYGKLAAAT